MLHTLLQCTTPDATQHHAHGVCPHTTQHNTTQPSLPGLACRCCIAVKALAMGAAEHAAHAGVSVIFCVVLSPPVGYKPRPEPKQTQPTQTCMYTTTSPDPYQHQNTSPTDRPSGLTPSLTPRPRTLVPLLCTRCHSNTTHPQGPHNLTHQ